MLQIIPENRKQSTASRFAEAFGNASSSLAKDIPEHMMQTQQKKQQGEFFKKVFGEDISDLPPEIQKTFVTELLRQQGKEKLQKTKFGYVDELFNKDKPTQNKPKGIMSPENEDIDSGFNTSNINDEDILRATAADPNLGRALGHAKDVSLREKREQEKFKYEKEKDIKKDVRESFRENDKYINKVYDSYEDAERKSAIFDRMDQLEETGELSNSGVVNLLESIGLKPEWLKNPANEEYTKLGLDTLGGGTLQADYGSRVLVAEFKVSLQRIPTLSQTPEGRKQIKENLKAMLLPAKLKKERLQYYLDKAERTGEPLPHDLRGKVLRDIKPELDEAYDAFKQRNGRYKVKEGTYPDDSTLEKYYFLANKNENKALKMMKEDGYDTK